jgi:hypothetical protein
METPPMTAVIARRGFRDSIRSLMIAVAFCALFLAPLVLLYRWWQAARMERIMAVVEAARAQAETARVAQLRVLAPFNPAPAIAPHQTEIESQADGASNLWAALSVNHPLFEQGQTKELTIEFTLVNDGDTAIEPKMAESSIVINGKELADSGLILGHGSKDSRYKSLPPRAHLQFSSALGDQFNKPGVYRVSWKGKGFQSPEITIRVLRGKTD